MLGVKTFFTSLLLYASVRCWLASVNGGLMQSGRGMDSAIRATAVELSVPIARWDTVRHQLGSIRLANPRPSNGPPPELPMHDFPMCDYRLPHGELSFLIRVARAALACCPDPPPHCVWSDDNACAHAVERRARLADLHSHVQHVRRARNTRHARHARHVHHHLLLSRIPQAACAV